MNKVLGKKTPESARKMVVLVPRNLRFVSFAVSHRNERADYKMKVCARSSRVWRILQDFAGICAIELWQRTGLRDMEVKLFSQQNRTFTMSGVCPHCQL